METGLDEIRENQKRLGGGITVLSEMLEDILKELQAGGLANQIKFRGDKPKPARRKPAHSRVRGWAEGDPAENRRPFATEHRYR